MFQNIFWSSSLHARETEDDDDVFKNVIAYYNSRTSQLADWTSRGLACSQKNEN